MPNATTRASARIMPEATPKPDATAKEFILEQLGKCERQLRTARTEDEMEALAAEKPNLGRVSDELYLVHDLVEAAYMAATSIPSDIGGAPLSGLLNLTSDKLKAAIDQLENIAVMAANETNHLPVAEDEIKRAVEARRRTLEATVALATGDGEKDRIARDIDACKSLLRKLDISMEGA